MSFVPTQAHINNVSLLELNFAENLLQGLRQAVSFLASRVEAPRVAGITMSYERMCDVLMSIMEIHSLLLNKDTSASVGERYMGMKRIPLRRRGNLNRWQKVVSLVDAIVVPYMMSRNIDQLDERGKNIIKTFKFLKSVFSILYLLRITSVASPLHLLAGIKVVRHFELRTDKPKTWKDRFRDLPSLFVWALVYSIQFSQWYVSHQEVLRPKPSQKVVSPPPDVRSVLADPRLCPICLLPRRNPTALISTGEVFCYSCLTKKMDPESVQTFTRRVVE